MRNQALEVWSRKYVFKSEDGKQLDLYRPFVRDDGYIGFRFSPQLDGKTEEVWVQHKKKELVMLTKKGESVSVLINRNNQGFLELVNKFRELAEVAIRDYNHRLKTKQEKLVALLDSDNNRPACFLTRTMLEIGFLSNRFEKGFLYYVAAQHPHSLTGYEAWNDLLLNNIGSMIPLDPEREWIEFTFEELRVWMDKKVAA